MDARALKWIIHGGPDSHLCNEYIMISTMRSYLTHSEFTFRWRPDSDVAKGKAGSAIGRGGTPGVAAPAPQKAMSPHPESAPRSPPPPPPKGGFWSPSTHHRPGALSPEPIKDRCGAWYKQDMVWGMVSASRKSIPGLGQFCLIESGGVNPDSHFFLSFQDRQKSL